MLQDLVIRNLAIIDEIHLQFGPGFSVLTGETGAGKSIIIDGVNLLLGGRADSSLVRAGAKRAQIEGFFLLPPHAEAIHAILEKEQLWGDEPGRLILEREVRANGRSSGRVNGHLVSLALLREIGAGLVDIHGQGDHLSLMNVREHVNLLDRYAGLVESRTELARQVRRLDKVRAELCRLKENQRDLARRADLLAYQIQEIQGANLRTGEEPALQEERTRLANAEQLAELADEAYAYLEGQDDEIPAVRDLMGAVLRALNSLIKVDSSQGALSESAEQISFQVDELLDSLREYREQIEFNPRRLERVEERLELLRRLQRKYGDTAEEILAYARQAQTELEGLTHSEEREADLEAEEIDLLQWIGQQGASLSNRRREAARTLAQAVEKELGDLRMPGARLEVDIQWRPDPDGAPVPADNRAEAPSRVAFDATGLDRVEFLISTNPGEPLKPMVKVVSGGETARLMLAIKTVLSRADQTPTLIFDEIDQGIGGRVGQTVGQKLWQLARGLEGQRQVICITHLPQLAGYGGTHYRIEKQLSAGRTVTQAVSLDDESERISELAQMLGRESPATRDSAREILQQVQTYTESSSALSQGVVS